MSLPSMFVVPVLRAILRTLALIGLTFSVWPVLVAGNLWLRGVHEKRRAWRATIFRFWSRAVLRILGIRVRIIGLPPASPFLLVSNHLGYLDIPLLAAHIDATFVAKAEIRDWPLAGLLCRSIGTIFIDRTTRKDVVRVAAEIRRAIDEGAGVVLFPEGTSSDGKSLLPFRSSLLEVAVGDSIPAVPVATIAYHTTAGEAGDVLCYWGDDVFLWHLWRLLGIPSASAAITFGAVTVDLKDRKAIANRLQQTVAGSLDETGKVAKGDGYRELR